MATSQIAYCILTPPAVSGYRMSANNTQSARFCCRLTSLRGCINAFLIFSACTTSVIRVSVSSHSPSEFLLLICLRHPPPVCTWSVLDIPVAKMRRRQVLSALGAEPPGESPQVDQLLSMHKLALTPPTCRPTCFVLPAQPQSLLVSVCFLVYTFFSHDRVWSGDIIAL